MNKFPVVSPQGNEYEVKVYKGPFGYIGVDVYTRTKRKRWFDKVRHVWGSKFSWDYFSPEKWNYDYVAMATAMVREYEEYLERKRLREIKVDVGIKRFDEWDGIIRDGD